MNKLIGVKTTRFILITLSAMIALLAFEQLKSLNYSGALINVGFSLLLFIDAFNPLFFLEKVTIKNFFMPTVIPLNYKAGFTIFAWSLVLTGIFAKLLGLLF